MEEEEAAVEALEEDIACVVRAFASVVPRREGEGSRATLSLLRSTLCSRLPDADVTSARLMVTYCGASTEICDETTSAVIAAANAGGGNVFGGVEGARSRLGPAEESAAESARWHALKRRTVAIRRWHDE